MSPQPSSSHEYYLSLAVPHLKTSQVKGNFFFFLKMELQNQFHLDSNEESFFSRPHNNPVSLDIILIS